MQGENGGPEITKPTLTESSLTTASDPSDKKSGASIDPRIDKVVPGFPNTQGLDCARQSLDQAKESAERNSEDKGKTREERIYQELKSAWSHLPDQTLRDESKESTLITDAAHPVAVSYAKLEWMKPYTRKRVICKFIKGFDFFHGTNE